MKKKILYFDCFAGISGDMTVSALLDLGVDFKILQSKLAELNVSGYSLDFKEVMKNGISAKKFDVKIDKTESHVHRHLKDVKKIIQESTFNENVKKLTMEMFTHVAVAEAKIHNKPIDKIHFHEVGAIDSIIDILSVAYCIDQLEVDEIYSSPISCGKGFVNCAHGKIPVPAPATLEILQNIPINFTEIPKELTTPTGATIIKTLVHKFKPLSNVNILKTGYGAGYHDLEIPNVLRVMLGEIENESDFVELVTNIDDMNPETYSYIFEKLFKNGALDVCLENIIMKKNRPGIKLSVICHENDYKKFENLIFQETTTFGIRKYPFTRSELKKEFIKVDTEYGKINVKAGYLNGKMIKYSPEYEDCKRYAEKNNVSLKTVYDLCKL